MDIMILLNSIKSGAIRDNMLIDLMIKNECPDKQAIQEALGQIEVIVTRLIESYEKTQETIE